jgi:uncharacterized membrane protein YcgQ (UPF0703/DUF1980 family)
MRLSLDWWCAGQMRLRLPSDQWVQVEGHFAAGEFAGQPYPILVATSLKPVDVPNQPYLYP